MPILNQKDFENAKRDIDDIGKSVNTDAIINPRWGGLFESIPRLSRIASQKIEDWQAAINLITINDGIPALAVSDASGKNQQEINNGVETIADLLAIKKPYQGARIYVKGYHAPTNLALAQPYQGGDDFVYNASKSSVNDGICCFNGWERQGITDFVTPEMAGAKRDNSTDDIEAFEIAGMYAFTNRIKRVLLGSGYYVVSRSIKAYAGVSYYQRGVTYQGQGKGATYILVNGGGNGIEIVRGDGGTTGQITNVKICDLTLESKTYQVGIGIHSTTNISGIYLDEINFINWDYATKFDNTFYICSFTGLFASLCKNGFHNGITGTTLWIDRCYVQSGGSTTDTSAPSAFKLNAAYSAIGSLACDNYAGIAYNFDFGSSSVGSLGIERSTTNTNPHCEMVKFTATGMVIDNFYLLNTEGLTATNTIFNNSTSKVEIGNVRIANNNSAITTCPAVFSNVASQNSNAFKANTSFKSLKLDVTFADYVPATSSRAATTTTQIDHVKYLYGRYRPYVGLYDKQSEINAMFGASQNIAKTSMFFDIYGDSFRYSGYEGEYDGRYQAAPLLGDWGIQRRPDIHGIAAVVNLKEGASDINGILPSENSIIPLINRKLPTDPKIGAFHLTTSKFMNTWDGTAWMEVATPTLRYSGTYNPLSIAANSFFKYELALVGVTPSHFAQVAFSIDDSGVEITARAGTDKVYVYFKNLNSTAVDLASGTLKVLAKL